MQRLRDPALDLIQDVFSQLEDLSSAIISKVFARFPALIPELKDEINEVLSGERDRTRDIVEAIIEAEENCIFTNDLDFKENKDPLREDQSKEFVKQIRARVDHYFTLVLKTIRDIIPKQVCYHLVKKSQTKLQQTLFIRIQSNNAL